MAYFAQGLDIRIHIMNVFSHVLEELNLGYLIDHIYWDVWVVRLKRGFSSQIKGTIDYERLYMWSEQLTI